MEPITFVLTGQECQLLLLALNEASASLRDIGDTAHDAAEQAAYLDDSETADEMDERAAEYYDRATQIAGLHARLSHLAGPYK